MASTRLSFSYPEELKEKLMSLAENAEGGKRTLSSYIQNILVKHIEETDPPIKFKKVTVDDIPKPVKKKTRKRTRK